MQVRGGLVAGALLAAALAGCSTAESDPCDLVREGFDAAVNDVERTLADLEQAQEFGA